MISVHHSCEPVRENITFLPYNGSRADWNPAGLQEEAVPSQSSPFLGHAETRQAVLGVKMEYLEEFGFEMLQPDELSRWWSTSSLSPPGSCDVVVSLCAIYL